MNEPKISFDGNCPSCSSINWTPPKLLWLEGQSCVDLKSKGGGFGVGVGSDGVDVRYQGLSLESTGTLTQRLALEYSPPTRPDEYERKGFWLKEPSRLLEIASAVRSKIVEFSEDTKQLKPGMFSDYNESNLLSVNEKYIEAVNWIAIHKAYDYEMSIWNNSRVCLRCGEYFIEKENQHLLYYATDAVELPYLGVKCPTCRSYQYKTAKSFFNIKVAQLEKEVETANKVLDDAKNNEANEPNNNFLKKILKTIFYVKPAAAKKNLDEAEVRLSDMLKLYRKHREDQKSYSDLCVCVKCEEIYHKTKLES